MDWEKQVDDASKKNNQFDILKHHYFSAFTNLLEMGYPENIILDKMLDLAEEVDVYSPRVISALFTMWKEERNANKS